MNGDQRNNHVYEDLAALPHRQQDIAWGVGGVASYLPANWDIPWYFAAMHLPTPVTVFLLGMFHAVPAGLVAAIVWSLLRAAPPRPRAVATTLAAAASIWSPAYLAEFGTTYGNIVTAIPVLGAVLVMVRREQDVPTKWRAFFFGSLLGLAFGLKLTNGPFLIAGLVALLVIGARSVQGLRAVFVGGFGAVVGIAAGGGAWFTFMARRFGNPLFPFYNAVFPSPYGPDANVRDEQFAVHTWSDAMLMPFRMAVQSGYPSELRGRDVRWVVLLVAALVVLVVLLASRAASVRWTRPSDGAFVLTFVAVGFVLWDAQFAIARYDVPLELMGGAVLVCLADLIGRGDRAKVAMLAAATLVIVPWVVVPRFFHQSPWHGTWYAYDAPPLARQAGLLAVFPTTDNASFLVAALPGDARAVQVPRIFPERTYPAGVVGERTRSYAMCSTSSAVRSCH